MLVRVALMSAAALLAMSSGTASAQSAIHGTPIYDGSPVPSGGSTIQYGGSTIQQGSSTTSQVVTRLTFEQKFWKYLEDSRYRQWSPVPGKTGDAYEGQSPHGATLKMYLNRKAAGRPGELPDGSIIVKENFGPDGEELMAITVMYRSTGYNEEAGDWYWVKYKPNGQVDQKVSDAGSMKLAGKVGGCIECHSGARGDDFAFFNDE